MSSCGERVFSVSEINTLARELIEEEFATVAIVGEVSNLRVHSSGHVYFKLKDARAQLSAVCFRGDARLVDFELEDGMQLVARGRLTVYEAQGQYQLVARELEPAGRGDLERAFRLLVAKLQAEGLFDESRKRPLPAFPRGVAVVTSATGAAIRDILSTLRRRFPCVAVLFVPVQVQGDAAPGQIVRALDALSARDDVDVVIVGRGGGSIEDLWAFNDEQVARAIRRCAHPVISAVGHESDVTIADFVADARAATPTMAAEIAVPVRAEVQARIARLERALAAGARARVDLAGRRVASLLRSYALGHVRGRIEQSMQRVDHAADRLVRDARLLLRDRATHLEATSARLDGLSPREVLRRGYSLCVDPANGRLVASEAGALGAGRLRITFHDGAVSAAVEGAVRAPGGAA
jgi:exodeoxyribonuclease VII large subunit